MSKRIEVKDHQVSLDYTICRKIGPSFYSYLTKFFPDIKIFSRAIFREMHNQEPCIGTIFIVSPGGSFTTTLQGHECSILNGTLSYFGDKNDWTTLSNMYEKLMLENE